MPRRSYYNSTPYLDLLFNTLIGFVLLFIVAFLMINPLADRGQVQTKAEFVITVLWEDNNQDDVDTWLQDPLGNVLYFREKDIGVAHLDRDDLGRINDLVTLGDGSSVAYPHNQELTTIRGIVAGEWTLNLHMYTKRERRPTEVEVRIDKLNPRVETVLYKKIILEHEWEEVTVSRFGMRTDGTIDHWDDLPKGLVEVHYEHAS